MHMFKRMSFFTRNLLLACINILLIGALLITSSYIIVKDILISQLQDQINTTTRQWADGLKPDQIKKAMAEKSYNDPVQKELTAYLDQVNKYYPNIAQAYVFGTELQDGNKTSIAAMPTNLVKAFGEANMNVGAMYEEPEAMVTALNKVLKTGKPAFTAIYSDDFGVWTTIQYPIKDANGKIFAFFAADVDASAVPNGLKKLLATGLTITAIFLIVIFLVQFFLSRKMLRPIRELIRGIEQVSEGNLDIVLKAGEDDLGKVNGKFNGMVKRISDTMEQVQMTSTAVADSARNLNEVTEQNSRSVQTITASMQEIAGGIAVQEQATRDGARAMGEITTVIQTIAENTSKVTDEALEMENKSIEGNNVVRQATRQMGQIEDFVSQTANAVKLLDNRSQEIGEIVSIITGISSQTNLLALNAAIEAARVGEHGKGFAVVADEVRKLAEQSANSSNQITELIKEIQNEIHNAVQAMEQGSNEVRLGMQIMAQMEQLFGDIVDATKTVTYQIQEVSSATEEISAGTEELTSTVENLSATAGVTADNSTKINTSIEEQQSSMESLVDATNSLAAMSEQLHDLISYFQVRSKS